MPTDRPGGYSAGERVPAYILAGGHSRRFGSDKARALVDGEAMVSAVARTIAPRVVSVTVVAAREGAYDDLGLATIGDVVRDRGPLGGLLTAIKDRGDGWLLLVACDWVGVDAAWIEALARSRSDSSDAVAFRTDRFEPLLALYHTRVLPIVERHLEAGTLSMQALLSRVRTVCPALPPGWGRAANRNVPPPAAQ